MNRRAAAILLGSVFLLALATLVLRRGSQEVGDEVGETPEVVETPGELVPVELYFPSSSGRLAAETREVPYGRDSEGRLRAILEELLIGPTTEESFPPLPETVGIGDIHVSAAGAAYVDLISTEHARPPVTGTRDEILTIYSLVNSLLVNTPEIKAIYLLWNGQQLDSFAGHIDTTRPLVANPDV